MVKIKFLKTITCIMLALLSVYLFLMGFSMLYHYATLPYRISNPWIEYNALIMSAFMIVYAILIILFSVTLLSIALTISLG